VEAKHGPMTPQQHTFKKAGITIIYTANFSLQPIKEEVSIMAYKKYAS